MAKKNRIFRVNFMNQGTVYELYASGVSQSDMYGFIEVEGLIFGEKSALLVDPSEEKLKSEFEGVQRIYVPMHALIRIDEVDKEGTAKIKPAEGGSNVAQFPSATPPADKG